jgi:hypothetical protein
MACVVLAAAVAGCGDVRSSEAQRIASARVSAENAVLIASRVPQSVVFRNEVVVLRPRRPVVCGEFNGRNRHGVMVGFSRFIVSGSDVLFDDGQPGFDDRWREACAAT